MAIDVKTALANKLIGELDKNISQITRAQDKSATSLNAAKDIITGNIGNFSPIATIDSAVNDVKNQASSIIPDFNSDNVTDEIRSYISDCEFLNVHEVLGNIGNIFKSIASDITDDIVNDTKDFMGAIMGAIPELDIGLNLNLFEDEIKDVKGLVSECDSILNCLDETFGVDTSVLDSKISSINSSLDAMNLDVNGKISKDNILQAAGVSKGTEDFLGILSISDTISSKVKEATGQTNTNNQTMNLVGVQEAKSGNTIGAENSIITFVNFDDLQWVDDNQYISKDVLDDISWARVGAVRESLSHLEKKRTTKRGTLSPEITTTLVAIQEFSDGTSACDFKITVDVSMKIGNIIHVGSAFYLNESTPPIYSLVCGDWALTDYSYSVLSRGGQLAAEFAFKNALDDAILNAGQDFTFEELDNQL